jgi:RsiW-degrading membrane proteinase PrsW (M82 family)
VHCDHCGKDVPDGVFCANCGAHQQTSAGRRGARRLDRYAAHPGEHGLHPGVFTTLFPHLGHRKVHEFRFVFAGGVLGIFVLFLVGLITAALCVAALLLPVLYLLYLYEAQVYREEPLLVLVLIAVGSIGLGVGMTVLTDKLVPNDARFSLNVTGSALVITGVLIPLIQEAAKPIPALLLRVRTVFRDETMDGLVFGVAAGLGFGVGETFVRFANVLTELPVRSTPGSWIFPLLTTAVLLPLLQGTATGLVCAGIWRAARGRADLLSLAAIVIALAGHIAFISVGQVVINHGWSQLVLLGWQSLVDVALLLALRILLHTALLEEAAEGGFVESYCPHCNSDVLAGSFCPSCGMSMSARPLHVRGFNVRRAHPEAG